MIGDRLLYSESYKILDKVYISVIKTISDLHFNGTLEIYGHFDKISIPDNSTYGFYDSVTNRIGIHEQCILSYKKGDKTILLQTIIHELIHANGEKDEKSTEEKTMKLYNIHKNALLSLL